MRVINKKTGFLYELGDPCAWNGNDVLIEKKLVKVCNISDKELQLVLDAVEEDGTHIYANFWKSNLGKDPNIYKDGDNYKLVEIEENDIIEIWGFTYDYKGFKQFNPCGGYTLTDEVFNLKTNMDKIDYKVKILNMINSIDNIELRNTCNEMLAQIQNIFYTKPAAAKHHHNYVGGLLQHTYEVMATAYAMLSIYKANKDVVITSALFHDVAKVWEYTDVGGYYPYALKIGHIVGSADFFKRLAESNDVDYNLIEDIYHCILAHHGKKEWGSPVEPQTMEAVIIHEADMISSYINPIMMVKSNYDDKDYYLV